VIEAPVVLGLPHFEFRFGLEDADDLLEDLDQALRKISN